MSIDMSKYLGLFVTESTEHLEALSRDLVELEKDRGVEALDSMFRHAHSVKGMAASMGFEATATLAHRLEDLFDAVRADPTKLDRDLVDLLLSAVDTLLAQVRVTGEGGPEGDSSMLREQLGERVSQLTGKAPERTRIAEVRVQPVAVSSIQPSADLREVAAAAHAYPDDPHRATGYASPPVGSATGPAERSGPGVASSERTRGKISEAVRSSPGVERADVTSASSSKESSAPAESGVGGGKAPGAQGSRAGPGTASVSNVGDRPGVEGPQRSGAQATGVNVAGAKMQREGPSVTGSSNASSARAVSEGAVSQVTASRGASGPAPAPDASVASSPPAAPRLAPLSDHGLGLPPRFALKVKIASTCPVPGVRAYLVHRRLSGLGNVFDLRPALEDLKAGRIPDGLISLELETATGEEGVRGALGNVPDAELVSLKAVVPGLVLPPTPVPPPAAEVSKIVGQELSRTVRVKAELLDYFLDTAGELLLATARIREVGKTPQLQGAGALDESVDRLHGLVKDLHDKVMKARMTPLAVVTDRLPRAARDIARKREREVDLVISGAETELDRAIVDELSDPLLHILRNCIDHGIETPAERVAAGKSPKGRVLVSVRRHRDRVAIEIEDDGRGMDAAKLKASAVARGLLTSEAAARMSHGEALLLSCLPGVSTAKDVSEISGRGVGMDSVKRTVESVGGTLEMESEKGRGTRFVLRLPLTVAVVNLLLVAVGEELYGLPIGKVMGVIEADEAQLDHSRSSPLISHSGSWLPVYSLAALLEIPAPPRIGVRPFVVMEGESGKVALAVDRLLTQQEVVLKALSRPLDLVPGLSGVTILGTGRPVFILDVPRLLAG